MLTCVSNARKYRAKPEQIDPPRVGVEATTFIKSRTYAVPIYATAFQSCPPLTLCHVVSLEN